MNAVSGALRRGLYLVTPDLADTARLLAISRAALAGGATCLQYRHKTASRELRSMQAAQLATLCREHGAGFLVNDDVELAVEVGAHGVHIGRDDGDPTTLRERHPHLLIGVSCYDDFERARLAAAAGADYIAFGAMYPSPTKPAAVAAPMSLVSRAKAELGITVACIGGITAGNAAPLVAAGADLLAVITDIYSADDPRAQAARFAALFSSKDRP